MSDKKPIAQIDLDGTLTDYDTVMLEALASLAGPDETNTAHDLEAAGSGKGPAYIKARERMIKRQTNFWFDLPPLEVGFTVLKEIEAAGFSINILTKGPPLAPNAWSEKFLWCRKYLPHAKVSVTEDKSYVFGHVLFDDWVPYVKAWLEEHPTGTVLMLDHSHNQGYSDARVLRINKEDPDINAIRAVLKATYEAATA
jgi:hypothetical protein